MDAFVRRRVRWLIERFVGEHYLVITVVSLAITVISGWVLVSKWQINSDFRALLPDDAPATAALEEVEERLGSATAMFIVVDSPSFEANRRYAEELAERLRSIEEVVLAHFHNEKAFFETHRLLYLGLDDLQTIRDRIDEAIRREKRRANPLFVPLGEEDSEPVEFRDLEEKYSGEIGKFKEYLVADDGRALTIVVRFSEAASNFERTRELLTRIKGTAKELAPESYHPEMTVDYAGGLVARQQQYESVMDEVGGAAFGELAVLLLVIGLFFRKVRSVLFVFVPLIMGVVWTLALALLALGELTTISVFIFAILLGLGIDFTLHILNSYDRYGRAHERRTEALVHCYSSTGRATVVGGSTTFATFLVLAFAEFRGIAEFGQIAALGIGITLLTMLVVLPALILTAHRIWPERERAKPSSLGALERPGWGDVPPRLGWFTLLGLGFALVAGAAYWAPSVEFEEDYEEIGEVHWPWSQRRSVEVEPGVRRARRQARRQAEAVRERAVDVRRSMVPKTFEVDRSERTTREKYVSAVQGQISSIPIVLLFDEAESARRAYRTMKELHDEGRLRTFESISSIYSFLPASAERQRERLVEIERIRELLEETDLSGVRAKMKRRIADLRDETDVQVVGIRDLPDWTKRFFREAGVEAKPPAAGEPFAYEYVIFVVSAVRQLNGPDARRLVRQLDLVREEVEGEFVTASEAEAYVGLLDAIQTSGIRLVLIGIAVVLLILMVAFRHPIRGLISISSLAFSGLLLFGILGAVGIRFDVYNVVFLTAIVGISVDDDVHLYMRYLDLGRGRIIDAVRWVGPAVAMNTLTSGIGFGGLALTENAGLQSIGHLAVVGVICSLLSTVVMLPLVLRLAEWLELESVAAEPGGRAARR